MSKKKTETPKKEVSPLGGAVENLMAVCKANSEKPEADKNRNAVFCIAIDEDGINMSLVGHEYVVSAMLATAMLEDERIAHAMEAARLMSEKMKEEVSEYKPTTEA